MLLGPPLPRNGILPRASTRNTGTFICASICGILQLPSKKNETFYIKHHKTWTYSTLICNTWCFTQPNTSHILSSVSRTCWISACNQRQWLGWSCVEHWGRLQVHPKKGTHWRKPNVRNWLAFWCTHKCRMADVFCQYLVYPVVVIKRWSRNCLEFSFQVVCPNTKSVKRLNECWIHKYFSIDIHFQA